jgi:hypothetical protein
MSKVIVEFDWKYGTLTIHSDISLSGMVNALESMTGTVLVTQPSLYDLEVFLDRAWYSVPERRKELQSKLAFTFRQFDMPIEYVEN